MKNIYQILHKKHVPSDFSFRLQVLHSKGPCVRKNLVPSILNKYDERRIAGQQSMLHSSGDGHGHGKLAMLDLAGTADMTIDWQFLWRAGQHNPGLFGALLRSSRLWHDGSLPRQHQTRRAISAVPRAEKRFIRAMRIWISAVWRSGSLAAMRSPKAFRHRIFALMRLRT